MSQRSKLQTRSCHSIASEQTQLSRYYSHMISIFIGHAGVRLHFLCFLLIKMLAQRCREVIVFGRDFMSLQKRQEENLLGQCGSGERPQLAKHGPAGAGGFDS